MPTYSIQAPDGTTVRVQANDPQSAMQAAQRQWAQSQGAPRSSPPPASAPRRQAQPPAKQDNLLDMANGAIRSFAEGFPVAGGLANRANAALAATVAPAVEPMLDMIPGHDRGQDVTPGGGDWQGRYGRALAMQNGMDAKFQAQHPNVATTAGLAGGVIGSYALARGFGVPAGAPLKPAPSVLGGLVNGGKTVLGGTAFGAADGAARAPDGQQGDGAFLGGALGGATTLGLMGLGALTRPVAGWAGSKIMSALGPEVPGITGEATNSQARKAAAFVGGVMTRSGRTPADLQAAAQPYAAAGKPVTVAETIGKRGITHLSLLAKGEGQTGDAAEAFFGNRRAQMGDRILSDIAARTGIDPEGARGNIEAVVAKGQMDANPLFDAVRSHPGPVWNADLSAIAERPSVKVALKLAYNSLLDAGKNPTEIGLAIDPETGNFIKDPATLQPVPEAQPRAEAWEYVRRMLGDLGEPPADNAPAKAKILAGNARIAQGDLTNALAGDENGDGALIPGYREAIDTAGDYLSAKDAFGRTRGMLFGMGRGKTAQDMAQLWDGLKTPGEQFAAKHAVAADIYDAAMRNRLTPGTWSSPDFQAKLAVAFPDASRDIVQNLSQEGQMMNAGNVIKPGAGSQTFPLKMAADEQSAVHPGAEVLADTLAGTVHGNPIGGLLGGLSKQSGKLIDSVVRQPGLPVAAKDEAGRLLMADPDTLAAYLQNFKVQPVPPLQLGAPSAIGGGLMGGLFGSQMLPKQQQTYQLQPSQ